MIQANTNEYFRLFFETAQAILSARNLQETLDSLVQRTVAALEIKAGGLRLIDEESNNLKQVASFGLSETYLNKGALNADQSIPEVLEGIVVYVKDACRDPRIQYPDAMRAEGIGAVLSVPVIAGEKVIGVLRLYSAEPHDYSDEDVEFVSALAEMGGMAIVNARLYEDEGEKLASLFDEIGVELPTAEEEHVQQVDVAAVQTVDPSKSLGYFRTLHEVTQAVLSTLDSKEVIQLIVDKVINIMQVKASALRLRNETTHELELIATTGLSDKFLAKGQPHTDQSISATLAGKPVLITDTASDPRLEYPVETVAEGIASILSMPIVARQRVIGVLRLYSAEKRQYSQEEITFLSALAEIA
ncbi:MAG: GAF domain-containing protein, partial [Desulfuromonadales bacterium]|nr:GAF domain-containing protein [Desulfuromonadales bacterium]